MPLTKASLTSAMSCLSTSESYHTSFKPFTQTETRPYGRLSVLLVAGSGFEPEPGGYEPPELPLLYPAIGGLHYSTKGRHYQLLQEPKFTEYLLKFANNTPCFALVQIMRTAAMRNVIAGNMSIPRLIKRPEISHRLLSCLFQLISY